MLLIALDMEKYVVWELEIVALKFLFRWGMFVWDTAGGQCGDDFGRSPCVKKVLPLRARAQPDVLNWKSK